MDISTKIKLAEIYAHITETELCKRMGVTPQSFGQRLKTAKFSYEDYEKIGKALGADIELVITFPDGQKF